jgi:hypothetical protein
MTLTELLSLYDEVWAHDFEFISKPGHRPDVVCLAAHELCSGRKLKLWRTELRPLPPYRTDKRVLFVNYVGNAECGCHLALGWSRPANVLDLSPAFRRIVCGRQAPQGRGLIGALIYYGLDSISAKQKDATRERIIRGWPFAPEEQQQILVIATATRMGCDACCRKSWPSPTSISVSPCITVSGRPSLP